ncbi:unnamed protein product [Effrenium voratum]|nr:unnamed protein product [Effrenium voratum]
MLLLQELAAAGEQSDAPRLRQLMIEVEERTQKAFTSTSTVKSRVAGGPREASGLEWTSPGSWQPCKRDSAGLSDQSVGGFWRSKLLRRAIEKAKSAAEQSPDGKLLDAAQKVPTDDIAAFERRLVALENTHRPRLKVEEGLQKLMQQVEEVCPDSQNHRAASREFRKQMARGIGAVSDSILKDIVQVHQLARLLADGQRFGADEENRPEGLLEEADELHERPKTGVALYTLASWWFPVHQLGSKHEDAARWANKGRKGRFTNEPPLACVQRPDTCWWTLALARGAAESGLSIRLMLTGPKAVPAMSMSGTDLLVRPAREADGPAIDMVLQASYSVLLRGTYEDEVLDAFLPHIIRVEPDLLESGRFFVATDLRSGAVVACGGWSSQGPDAQDTEVAQGLGHLRQFAVHPEWAGRGLGKRIFDACKRQAEELEVFHFECCSSLLAEGFYVRLGLRTVGLKEVKVKEGVPPIPCKLMTTRSDLEGVLQLRRAAEDELRRIVFRAFVEPHHIDMALVFLSSRLGLNVHTAERQCLRLKELQVNRESTQAELMEASRGVGVQAAAAALEALNTSKGLTGIVPKEAEEEGCKSLRGARSAIQEAKQSGVASTLIEQAKLKLRRRRRDRQDQQEACSSLQKALSKKDVPKQVLLAKMTRVQRLAK